MNETLRLWLEKARKYSGALSMQKRILLASLFVAVVAGSVGIGIVVNQDPYELLYSDLQTEDSKAVSKRLGELKIPYHMSEDLSTVSVPGTKVHQARMELAKAGVPGQDVVGFEKFDGSTLGMSSYVQRIQYIRAVQGELTRSIQRLSSVKRARVHISVPPKKTFLEDEEPPKASVVLELKNGQQPTKQEVQGMAHLVASAVEGLKVAQVTIVDTNGAFLHRPDEGSAGVLSSNLLDMQRSIESDYEKRITELLTPVVGFGKVRAKVTAEIDPSRTNTTEETYDPDKAVLRNSLKNDEVSQGSRPNPIGIPGSRSNLPGTETQNPPMPTANSTSEKNMANLNYAIPKKVQTTDKPSGNIKRLTVAVVVDGNYAPVNGVTAFTPRTEEELKRLQDIIGNAVGYDVQRRDSITVSSLPFKEIDVIAAPETDPKVFNWADFSRHATKNGLIALVVLLFAFLVVRPFLRWATLGETEQEMVTMPRTVAELEKARQDQGLLALSQAAMSGEDVEPVEKKEENDLTKKILERLDSSPRKGLRILQDWLEENEPVRPVGEAA